MHANNLKNTLKILHTSLEKTNTIDPELQGLLKQLDNDIHQLLLMNAGDSTEASSLMERTQSIGAKFSVQHPHIELIMRELADILGKMGI